MRNPGELKTYEIYLGFEGLVQGLSHEGALDEAKRLLGLTPENQRIGIVMTDLSVTEANL